VKRTLFILSLALTGCGSAPTAERPLTELPPRPPLLPVTAAALAFDPPVALAGPLPSLSRDGRQNAAFVGYESQITDTYFLSQRDQQRFDGRGTSDNRFDRTAYMGRSSVTTR
jgi:hypothetical protein